MKKILVIIVLLVTQITTYTSETEKRIFRSSNKEFKEFMILEGTKSYEEKNYLDITLNNKGEKGELLFSRDHPNGTKLILFNETENYAENLFIMIEGYEDIEYYFDSFGFPVAEIFQISSLDLDQDGSNEIILSAANPRGLIMSSYIWSKGSEGYEYIGEIQGQYFMNYNEKDSSIEAPYGSFGLYEEYKLKDGKIIKIEE